MLLPILSLLSEPNSPDIEQGVSTPSPDFWTPGTIALCMIGLSILIVWLLGYDGFGALRNAPVRRNRMFGFLPVILLSVWLLLMMGINLVITTVFGTASELFRQVLSYPAMVFLEIGLIVVMLIIAQQTFARRLKGFGLNARTIRKDAGFALVYLLAVYPLILVALWVVLTLGRFVKEDFNLEVHQSLTLLTENGNLALTVLIILFATVIVPVFEEMLFRGFVQTSIRSLTQNPWVGILLTSVLFALLHPMTHAAALFCLSCGLGYAYERSGSLFRPIFMHIFFNGFSVLMTLWIGS